MGGDEFIVVLEELGTEAGVAAEQSKAVAGKIRSALASPYILNGHIHNSSPSIGICLFNGGDKSVNELLMQADRAMYQAKAAGGNTVRVSSE
jgi:diguanylate cyclase (GGDEF)-like protein